MWIRRSNREDRSETGANLPARGVSLVTCGRKDFSYAACFEEMTFQDFSTSVESNPDEARRRFSASLSFAILKAKTQLKPTMVATPMISTIDHLSQWVRPHAGSRQGAALVDDRQSRFLPRDRPQETGAQESQNRE